MLLKYLKPISHIFRSWELINIRCQYYGISITDEARRPRTGKETTNIREIIKFRLMLIDFDSFGV